jgi:hypothetical protein
MHVLVETFDDLDSQVLEESKGGPKKYIVQGIAIQSNIKNKNGRVYPSEIVDKDVARFTKDVMSKNRAVGELNHPTGKDPRINYERASHKFESLTKDGDNWVARAVVTKNTPMGSIVAGLMDENVNMGISSRAVGSTKESGGAKVVQKDFHLITPGDIVSDPSAPDAYLTNLMEGKEWVWANGILIEQEVEIKNAVNNLAKKNQLNEENMVKLFNYILSQI